MKYSKKRQKVRSLDYVKNRLISLNDKKYKLIHKNMNLDDGANNKLSNRYIEQVDIIILYNNKLIRRIEGKMTYYKKFLK